MFQSLAVLDTLSPSAPGIESNPYVATDGSGHWLAVWHSTDTLGGLVGKDWDILVSRSSDYGASWTPPVALNTNASSDTGNDQSPVLVTDEAGTWIAAWSSVDSLGGSLGLDRDVLVARSTDQGRTWSKPAPLNTNARSDWGDDWGVRLATDGDTWLAVWVSSDSLGNRIGGDSDILIARSFDQGRSWSAPQPLASNAGKDTGFDMSPDIATDGAGRCVVVWSSGDSLGGRIGMDRDILMARSTNSGKTWTPPEPLNTNAAKDSRADWTPVVGADGLGHWVAVWTSADSLGGKIGMDRDILVAYSSDHARTWSTAKPLNRNADVDAREDSSPKIAADGSGRWVVVWHSWDSLSRYLGVDADILVADSRDNGRSWSVPWAINPKADKDSGDDLLPNMTTDGFGHWVVVWQSFDPRGRAIGGFDWEILAAGGNIERGRPLPRAD